MGEFETDARLSAEQPPLEERQVEINQILRQLASRNPRLRSQAAQRLGELRAEPVALMAALDDPNPFVRSAAADALGYAAGDQMAEVVDRLLVAIDDPNDYVCASAIHSLGILRVEPAVRQIEECLDDPNPFVVQAAILALARLGAVELGERLAGFLESDNYLLQLAATRAVAMLGVSQAGERLLSNLEILLEERGQKDFKLPKATIDALARLKVCDAVPLLIRIAKEEVGLRSVAVEALIGLQADEAAALLAPMLNDPSDRLRRHLIDLMVSADYHGALPLIRGLLKDPSAQIRAAALTAIQTWRDPGAADPVRWMAFHDPNPFIRPQAVICLAMILEQDALPDLMVLARDLNPQVRQAVASCLGRLGSLDGEALSVLHQLTKDSQVSETAGLALQAHQADPLDLPDETIYMQDRSPVYTPPDLDIEFLLRLLKQWQAGLADSYGQAPVDQISEIDRAISTLLAYLKKR